MRSSSRFQWVGVCALACLVGSVAASCGDDDEPVEDAGGNTDTGIRIDMGGSDMGGGTDMGGGDMGGDGDAGDAGDEDAGDAGDEDAGDLDAGDAGGDEDAGGCDPIGLCYDRGPAGCCMNPSTPECVRGELVCPPGKDLVDRCPPCPEPGWSMCEVNSDCVIAPNACCEACGLPTADDYDGVNRTLTREHFATVCPGDPPPCPPCVPAPHPYLQATCGGGTCDVVDVRASDVSACTTDSECRLRVTQCCECGGDTSPDAIIAISTRASIEYANIVCDPEIACAECEPVYPDSVRAVCMDGHCAVASR